MWPMVAMCSFGGPVDGTPSRVGYKSMGRAANATSLTSTPTAETSLPSIGVNVTFATLFVCGGVYTTDDFDRWVRPFSDVNVTVVVAGNCSISTKHYTNVAIQRVPLSSIQPAAGGLRRWKYTRAKFLMWRLPYDRVVYYDIDILVKPPVGRCAAMCTSSFCAVGDIRQTQRSVGRNRSKPYFNSGFMVLRPSEQAYVDLLNTKVKSPKFVDQDILNAYYGRWQQLPKQCNWITYRRPGLIPGLISDPSVLAIHKWQLPQFRHGKKTKERKKGEGPGGGQERDRLLPASVVSSIERLAQQLQQVLDLAHPHSGPASARHGARTSASMKRKAAIAEYTRQHPDAQENPHTHPQPKRRTPNHNTVAE